MYNSLKCSMVWLIAYSFLTKTAIAIVQDSTQPENVKVSQLDDGQVQVSWDPPKQPPNDVERYEIDIKKTNQLIVILTNSTSTRTWRLHFDIVYKITVLAIFTNGDKGTPSPEVEFKRVPDTQYAHVGDNATSITLFVSSIKLWEVVRDSEHLFSVNGSEIYSNNLLPDKGAVSVGQDNVTVVLNNIESKDAGLYQSHFKRNQYIDYVFSGTRLVVVGKPTTPVISVETKKVDGDYMLKLTCKSQSGTKPTQFGGNITYEWQSNGESVPSDVRFSVTGGTFTILKLILADESHNITCTAKEKNGFLSNPTTYTITNVKDLISFSPPLRVTWMAFSVCLLSALLFPFRIFHKEY